MNPPKMVKLILRNQDKISLTKMIMNFLNSKADISVKMEEGLSCLQVGCNKNMILTLSLLVRCRKELIKISHEEEMDRVEY